MALPPGARRPAVVLVLVLLASWTTRGLCFMPATGEAGPRDAHGCCRTGWTEGTPGCCMSSVADEDPARIVVAVPLVGLAPASAATAFLPDRARTAGIVPPKGRSHSPPGPLPLRI
jgi:hypothetical protein